MSFNLQGIKLAKGYSFSSSIDNVQEYSFTIVNESGSNITDCYVTLDRSMRRFNEEDEWKIEQEKLIDRPFRWIKSGSSQSGKLNIKDGDRASFMLGRSIMYWAMDSQTKKNVPLFQFELALHGEEEQEGRFKLFINYFYKLLLTIRAKDQNGNRLPDIGYDMYLRPTASYGLGGGLEVQGQVRRK